MIFLFSQTKDFVGTVSDSLNKPRESIKVIFNYFAFFKLEFTIMKKRFILALIVFISFASFAQETMYKITFGAEFIRAPKNATDKEVDAQTKEIQDSYIAQFKNISTELIFDNSKSVYRIIAKLQTQKDMFYELAATETTSNRTWYVDREAKEKYALENFVGENVLVNLE